MKSEFKELFIVVKYKFLSEDAKEAGETLGKEVPVQCFNTEMSARKFLRKNQEEFARKGEVLGIDILR